ncbi:MAG: hypothetical protein Q4B14_02540, partial [Clostridia bacterium]|nr:hypothetical protein [Clostridia bacterium]
PEGKEFAGWSRTSNGDILTSGYITIESDTTVYAIWKDTASSDPSEPDTPSDEPSEPSEPDTPSDDPCEQVDPDSTS